MTASPEKIIPMDPDCLHYNIIEVALVGRVGLVVAETDELEYAQSLVEALNALEGRGSYSYYYAEKEDES